MTLSLLLPTMQYLWYPIHLKADPISLMLCIFISVAFLEWRRDGMVEHRWPMEGLFITFWCLHWRAGAFAVILTVHEYYSWCVVLDLFCWADDLFQYAVISMLFYSILNYYSALTYSVPIPATWHSAILISAECRYEVFWHLALEIHFLPFAVALTMMPHGDVPFLFDAFCAAVAVMSLFIGIDTLLMPLFLMMTVIDTVIHCPVVVDLLFYYHSRYYSLLLSVLWWCHSLLVLLFITFDCSYSLFCSVGGVLLFIHSCSTFYYYLPLHLFCCWRCSGWLPCSCSFAILTLFSALPCYILGTHWYSFWYLLYDDTLEIAKFHCRGSMMLRYRHSEWWRNLILHSLVLFLDGETWLILLMPLDTVIPVHLDD